MKSRILFAGRSRSFARGAALVALGLLAAGCSSVSNMLDFSKGGSTTSDAAGDSNASLKADDIECPTVTVRAGASTLTIAGKNAAPGGDPSALELRYQGSVVRTARECAVNNGNVIMKVGIEGRIIVGPAGSGGGQVDVPLRLAVVNEGPAPKTLAAKLMHIPVTVPPDAPFANFEHLESDIVFPLPRPASDLESYVVYVGFDSAASATQAKPAAKPRAKKKKS